MGRGRRRDRHFRLGNRPGAPPSPLGGLKPLFASVSEPWSDPAIAPVLPLEGMSEWEAIRLPALALEEPPSETNGIVPTSNDPFQLVLGPVTAEGALFDAGDYDAVDDEPDEPASYTAADPSEPLDEAPVLNEMSEPEVLAAAGDEVAVPDERTAEQLEAEADLEAVAELEVLTQAARADTHVADLAADMIARALEDSSLESERPAASADAFVAIAPSEAAPAAPEPEPDPGELLFGEAQEAAQHGRGDEARALYRQLLAQRPLHVRARNNLALLLDAAGDHNGALAELDRALDVEPDNPTVLVNRGALLGQMGRFQAAERDLKRVLRDEPANAEALFNLGVVMTKKGLWAEAVPALKRAIELDDGRAAAHFYLGEALNHVDDLPGAMLSYQRAAELLPSHSRALYGLGIVLDRMGRPDDAAQMYRRSREVAQTARR
jgi:tetratricopeptide (TPR) repeat protein